MTDETDPNVSVAELESRMRPGAFSTSGFLGADERLEEVIARDAATVRELGLTHEGIAAALDAVIDAAEEARGKSVNVPPGLKAQIELFTGFQICPWAPDPHHAQCQAGGGVRHGSVDWVIRNVRTRKSMRGPGLIAHLIRAHRFFEGRGSPNRVDPRELAQLLGLVS